MKKISVFILLLIIVVIIAGALVFRYGGFFRRPAKEALKARIVKTFPFSQDDALKEWEEKIFRGKVVYRIEKNQSLDYVRATSNKTASALYYRIRLYARRKSPVVSWKWNVDKFPEKTGKEDLETENEDDFAARIYVIFPAFFFTNLKVLEYIWAETLPEGLIGTSPYSNNIKLMVVRSGPNKDKKWFTETRDIIADYRKAFGASPEHDIGAVAFMTNTEHTGTSADAMYDDISLGYKE